MIPQAVRAIVSERDELALGCNQRSFRNLCTVRRLGGSTSASMMASRSSGPDMVVPPALTTSHHEHPPFRTGSIQWAVRNSKEPNPTNSIALW